MKPKEIRDLSDDALFERVAQLRESLFRLRFKLALGNQDTVRQLRVERKDLARVKTSCAHARWLARSRAAKAAARGPHARGASQPQRKADAHTERRRRQVARLLITENDDMADENQNAENAEGQQAAGGPHAASATKDRDRGERQDAKVGGRSRRPYGEAPEVSPLRAPHVEVHGA